MLPDMQVRGERKTVSRKGANVGRIHPDGVGETRGFQDQHVWRIAPAAVS